MAQIFDPKAAARVAVKTIKASALSAEAKKQINDARNSDVEVRNAYHAANEAVAADNQRRYFAAMAAKPTGRGAMAKAFADAGIKK